MLVRLEGLDVVVADDIERMRAYHRAVLDMIGAGRVREASDGREAFRIICDEAPDLLITDYGMEPEDGVELVRNVRDRTLSPDPYLPVVMVTAYTDSERIRLATDAGVNEVLHKPVSPRDLSERIADSINDPRPFIETRTYFGPDRRRGGGGFAGGERRAPGADIRE